MTDPDGPDGSFFSIVDDDGSVMEDCPCGHGFVHHLGPVSEDPRTGEGWLECTMCECECRIRWDPYPMDWAVDEDGSIVLAPEES